MEAWGISDVGVVRSQNQDAYVIHPLSESCLLAAVCDGMGGARSGNIASQLALDVFKGEVICFWREDMTDGELCQLLRSGVARANTTVLEQSRKEPEYQGMGTTLVAALITAGKIHIINVGDSRAYHIGKQGIRPVTVDHSFVQMMIDRGDITPEEAKRHPQKNLITRAIGTEETVEGDLYHLTPEQGDSLLLCSDGLSNLLADQEILFEVAHGEEKADCCRRLLDISKDRGAPDNVTVVLVSCC